MPKMTMSKAKPWIQTNKFLAGADFTIALRSQNDKEENRK
jgi:hypothetical protein